MNDQQKQRSKNNNASHTPNVIPATEIAKNPHPRANENIQEKITRTDGQHEPSTDVGSEITDGEDG